MRLTLEIWRYVFLDIQKLLFLIVVHYLNLLTEPIWLTLYKNRRQYETLLSQSQCSVAVYGLEQTKAGYAKLYIINNRVQRSHYGMVLTVWFGQLNSTVRLIDGLSFGSKSGTNSETFFCIGIVKRNFG